MANINGTDSNDLLNGTPQADIVIALAGNDIAFGFDGDDFVSGNPGEDQLNGNQGNDSVYGGRDNDNILGGRGNDLVSGNDGNDQVNGNAEDDSVYGGKGNDTVRGGKGNDRVFGDRGNDVLYGDLGTDTVTGGEGRDIFVLGSDGDTFADFTAGEDAIGLANGLSFSSLNIAQGTGANAGNTVITNSATGQVLAVLQGVNASTINEGDFTSNLSAIGSPSPSPSPTPTPGPSPSPTPTPTRPPVPTPTPTPPIPDPGDVLATARDLGDLAASQTISQAVGDADPTDIYRFSLPTASNVGITLNGLSADADVYLVQDINNDGEIDDTEIINYSIEPDTVSETINQGLAAGNYFIVVEQYEGDTNYNLNITATPTPAPADNAGNTPDAARNIGVLGATQTFTDFVGDVDPDDFYRFSLSETSNVSLSLTGLSADADVYLAKDRNGDNEIEFDEIIAFSEEVGNAPEAVNVNSLVAGEYLVLVEQYEGDTNYSLSLAASAATPTPTPTPTPPASAIAFSAAEFTVAENEAAAVVTVTNSGGNTTPVSAVVNLIDGSATAPADYTNASVTVTFGANDTTPQSVTIPIVNDTLLEGDETVNLTLSSVTGSATLGAVSSAELTITDDEVAALPAGVLAFSSTNFSVSEAGSNATITVTRTGGSTGAVSAVVNLTNGTATAPADYTNNSPLTVSFADGNTTAQTITIPITNDTLVEGNETVNLSLSSVTGGASLGTQSAATLTIVDDDTAPVPSYSADFGYGLVNTAAAVAWAAGQTTPLPDVPNFTGAVPNNNAGDLNLINAPEAWARGYTGQGIIVAVLDTGVDYRHPDLAANIWTNTREIAGNNIDDDNNGFVDDVRGWDFSDNDNDPAPNLSENAAAHGTHVAGTIAARRNGATTDINNNQFDLTGVAYNAQIMPLRVLAGNGGAGRFEDPVAAGIDYAVANGAQVINMSLGFRGTDSIQDQISDPATQAALQRARNAGVHVVAIASGNNRDTFPADQVTRPAVPARFALEDLAIAVGAVDRNRRFADFANPAGNPQLDYVVAPGVDVLSATPGNTYDGTFSGTSMAAPHVAGVIALMLNANPNLTPGQVENILIQTANPDGIIV